MAWAVGASFTARFGIWGAVGPTAILLAAIAVAGDRSAIASRLRPTGHELMLGTAAGVVMAVATHLLFPPATALVPWLRDDVAGVYAQFSAPGVARALLYLPVTAQLHGATGCWGDLLGSGQERPDRVPGEARLSGRLVDPVSGGYGPTGLEGGP